MQQESAVQKRYAAAAAQAEPALCCAVDYDPQYLKAIPSEVIERDYGCGDPSRWLEEGDAVLDLGSGTGKICFIASQIVGKTGKVIGVDMTDDMLDVARRYAPAVAENIGYANVEFFKGRIQDLALDLELLDKHLLEHPVSDAEGWLKLQSHIEQLLRTQPMIADASIDAVVSNCVLNLVDTAAKPQLFSELYRVISDGGRAVISDIVSDQTVPAHLQEDPELWSGCISGALTEDAFIAAFQTAGFPSVRIVSRNDEPWQTVEGIEFRSITVIAEKSHTSKFSTSSSCCDTTCCP